MTNHGRNTRLARIYVANQDGVERVRVDRAGQVHAYGTMPNTDKTGWYFAGYADGLALRSIIEANRRNEK